MGSPDVSAPESDENLRLAVYHRKFNAVTARD